MKSSRLGFSLVELIIAIAILVVLLGLIAPNFIQYVKRNKEKACRENREAILSVYQRCVYDTSIQALNVSTKPDYTDEGLGNVIPGAGGIVSFKPVENEVQAYARCPVDKVSHYKVDGNYGVKESDGTAWIRCPVCGDIVSVDMIGNFKHVDPSPDPDKPVPTMEPVPTPIPSPDPIIVTFNNNGVGSYTPPSQTITELDGYLAKDPGPLSARDYSFKYWSADSAGTAGPFIFTTEIHTSMTLWAIWEPKGKIWPYPDYKDWWDPDNFSHAGDVLGQNLTNSGEARKYLIIKRPSGVFEARSGARFVFVSAPGWDGKIYQDEVQTPESYSATHPDYLIQIIGEETYDITRDNLVNGGAEIELRNLKNGTWYHFIDGSNTYDYVFWDSNKDSERLNVSQLRRYEMKIGSFYRTDA